MNTPTIPGVYHITPGHTQLTETEEKKIAAKVKFAQEIIKGMKK